MHQTLLPGADANREMLPSPMFSKVTCVADELDGRERGRPPHQHWHRVGCHAVPRGRVAPFLAGSTGELLVPKRKLGRAYG